VIRYLISGLLFFYLSISNAKEIHVLNDLCKEEQSLLGFFSISDNDQLNQLSQEEQLFCLLSNENKSGFKSQLEQGITLDVKYKGLYLISLAALKEDSYFLKAMIDSKASLDLVSEYDSSLPTALFYAVFYGREENIDLLISSGADLNVPNDINANVAFYAATINQWDLVYKFLVAGASYDQPTEWGGTLIDVADSSFVDKKSDLYIWKTRVINFITANKADPSLE